MEDLLGFIFEFVVEVLIQVIFEAGVDAASRSYRNKENTFARSRPHRRFHIVPFLRLTLGRTNPPSLSRVFSSVS